MRESIGGTWLFGIVMTFIALFSLFLTYAINYTKAFNLKGEILNIIEREEGWTSASDIDRIDDLDNADDTTLSNAISVEAKAFNLVKSMGYNYNAAESIDCNAFNEKLGHDYSVRMDGTTIEKGGYCVTKYCADPSNPGHKTYYKVTTFIALKIPMFDMVLKIPITGETRTLFYDRSNLPCASE